MVDGDQAIGALNTQFNRLGVTKASLCACPAACASIEPSTAAVASLWRGLRSELCARPPALEGVFTSLPDESPEELALPPPVPQRTAPHRSGSSLVDWAHGLGIDLWCMCLSSSGLSAVGAAAATCRSLYQATLQEIIWSARFIQLAEELAGYPGDLGQVGRWHLTQHVGGAIPSVGWRAACREMAPLARCGRWREHVLRVRRLTPPNAGTPSALESKRATVARRLSSIANDDWRQVQTHAATACFSPTQLQPASAQRSHSLLQPNAATAGFSPTQLQLASAQRSHSLLQPNAATAGFNSATASFSPTQPQPASAERSYSWLQPNAGTAGFSPTQPQPASAQRSHSRLQPNAATAGFSPTQLQPASTQPQPASVQRSYSRLQSNSAPSPLTFTASPLTPPPAPRAGTCASATAAGAAAGCESAARFARGPCG